MVGRHLAKVKAAGSIPVYNFGERRRGLAIHPASVGRLGAKGYRSLDTPSWSKGWAPGFEPGNVGSSPTEGIYRERSSPVNVGKGEAAAYSRLLS